MDAGKVFHVSRKSVECLYNHGIKLALTSVLKQAKQPITAHYRAARPRAIFINVVYLISLAGSICAAQNHLIFY